MKRLNILVEGQTEETFCRDVLQPYFGASNIFITPRLLQTSAKRIPTVTGIRRSVRYKGGISSYASVKSQLEKWLREDKSDDVCFTIMFDLYRLPTDFPKYDVCQQSDPYTRVECIENEIGKDVHDRRFIPYIQLHEYEALILSKPDVMGEWYINDLDAIEELKADIASVNNPELINKDNPPSKRILKYLPGYKKVAAGPIITGSIGMPHLMASCRHFREWIEKLESC